MKQQTLLASQEDMLARLVHNLNYGDGVIILSGKKVLDEAHLLYQFLSI